MSASLKCQYALVYIYRTVQIIFIIAHVYYTCAHDTVAIYSYIASYIGDYVIIIVVNSRSGLVGMQGSILACAIRFTGTSIYITLIQSSSSTGQTNISEARCCKVKAISHPVPPIIDQFLRVSIYIKFMVVSLINFSTNYTLVC